MGMEISDKGNKSSRNPGGTKVSAVKDSSDLPVEDGDSRDKRIDGERAAEEEKMSDGDSCAIDIKGGLIGRSRNNENSKVCRICHFGSTEPNSSRGSELILLGCDCKGELGVSHIHCADAWFTQKGNRLCEICGKTAKNISNNAEDTSIFMMEWHEMRLVAATLDTSEESSRQCKKSFCNFLLGCLVLAFVLPWFFRGINVL